jgi:hypothetical protein
MDVNDIIKYVTVTESPLAIIYGCILVLLIVYSSEIPNEYKRFVDSLIGRVFGIAAVYGAIQYIGWVYGLLTAMAFLLLLHGGVQMREGFVGDIHKTQTDKNRWFVERVLGERPSRIEIDRVYTGAPGNGS